MFRLNSQLNNLSYHFLHKNQFHIINKQIGSYISNNEQFQKNTKYIYKKEMCFHKCLDLIFNNQLNKQIHPILNKQSLYNLYKVDYLSKKNNVVKNQNMEYICKELNLKKHMFLNQMNSPLNNFLSRQIDKNYLYIMYTKNQKYKLSSLVFYQSIKHMYKYQYLHKYLYLKISKNLNKLCYQISKTWKRSIIDILKH